MNGCHDHCAPDAGLLQRDAGYRRVLWLALAANATMFLVELAAGQFGRSAALQADAVDFLGDATTYAITLLVLAMGIAARARAALAKAASMAAFGLWAVGNAGWHFLTGAVPEAAVMGPVALAACATNVGVAIALYRHRAGDANRRSVWLCSRNDAVANVAVVLAALAVAGLGAGWPDQLVAVGIAGLALSGAWSVARQATGELRHDHHHRATARASGAAD